MTPLNKPFTDEDLKRLKVGSCDPRLINTVEMVEALLSRLKAAEAILEWQDKRMLSGEPILGNAWFKMHKKWRKAAGK